MQLYTKILIGMLSGVMLGALLGPNSSLLTHDVAWLSFGAQWLAVVASLVGRVFLALIKMVVVPLVFFSLILGIASLGDVRKLGRIGGLTLGYFTATTVAALILGVALTNLFRPGALMSAHDRAMLLGGNDATPVMNAAASAPSMLDQLVAIVPSNPVTALAQGEMLQIIFFATMLGIALTLLAKERAKPVLDVCATLNDAMIVVLDLSMMLAPYGVAALLFKVVGTTGLGVLVALGAYAGVVLLGLLLHAALIYTPVVRLGARLPFLGFLRAMRAAIVLAFSTSSSSATLPVTLRSVESNLNVSNDVASFVLPIGATVNMDGTALYQGVAAVFIAQIYGIDLTLADQAAIVGSATMASIGTAGVPGAGMLTLAMVLATVGVPVEGVALILGIDRVLDMFRTTLNVIGDATAAVFVARMTGETPKIAASV